MASNLQADYTLDQRIDFLTRGIFCAKNAQSSTRTKGGDMPYELKDRLTVYIYITSLVNLLIR